MLQRLFVAVTLLLLSVNVSAQEIDKTDPYKMMKQVSQTTFQRLAADQALIQKNPEHLKVVVEEELMPYINDKYAALKLLGPNLKGAKREDVGEFITAFRACW